MRTTKRFTPAVLRRFARQGRGTGTFGEYQAWHQVSRGDPASRGRSHIVCWRDFQLDLLSDKEKTLFLLASMRQDVVDARAQFPLALDTSSHELEAYGEIRLARYPGIAQLASELKIRAPKLREGDDQAPWVSTTDLLLTVEQAPGVFAFIAVAFKYARELAAKRTKQLLQLEREYWLRRGVQWLMVTEALFDRRYAECLERVWWWALHCPVDNETLRNTAAIICRAAGQTQLHAIKQVARRTGDPMVAQHAFWQAIWCGAAPVDLRRGWRPHVPVHVLSVDGFRSLNPILCGRSAWIG
ncbi:TnsA endonuclease N-terminal domain-containing protein [Niveibacterium sp. COAC-50]|uniref:TnsA endonuclease N-terminal domain-containing protein n=1 Tax=Niveibacterium sp. COAC-50 TaxID=2729384 RepID=UPI001551A1D3|nr:TnsA endonuclease N-terminal domain-containing protein [Niveibacterium sp. COAC-50]